MPIKVLIIDDSALVRKLLCDILGSDPDIEILGTAPDPLIAIRKIKELNPDVLTLDVNMPRMDGRSFLAEMKAKNDLRAIPVVILTTSDVERDVISAYDLGAAGYIVKPVDIDQFFEVVQSLKEYWIAVVRIPDNGAG